MISLHIVENDKGEDVKSTGREFDTIVVGCGIAGLSAAVTASQKGMRVALLERAIREERGGNTRYTEAFMRMKSLDDVADDFESHFAENAGGYLDPGLVAESARPWHDWSPVVKALGFADPNLVSSFAGAAGETIRWLTSFGIKFDFLPTAFLTTCTTRLGPIGGGLAMVEALTEAAEKLGVAFFYETTARDLILDEHGVVIGVEAVGAGKGRQCFYGSSVILGCGGFEGNPEMLAQYIGPHATAIRPVARGGYYNRGEGIRMALRAGAAPNGDFSQFHAEPIDPRSGRAEPAILIYPYGILVNKKGLRFVDEAPGTVDAHYEATAREIVAQKDSIAYVILDAKLSDVPNKQLAIRTDQPPIEANDIASLARRIDVPAAALQKTVETYNAACRPGEFKAREIDNLATEGLEPPKSNWARPIDSPPFIAYPVTSANVFTFGGVKVGANAEVISTSGDPIPGLYAAGEVVGIYYKTYTGATSVLKGAVFGRLAGRQAAETAAGRDLSTTAA